MGNAGGVILAVSLLVGAFIIAAVPVIKLIGWWLDGGVEGGPAAVAIALYMAMAASVVAAPSVLKIVIIVILILSAVAMPFFGEISDRAGNKSIEDERLHQYARALEENPMNPAARIALAEALHKRGDRQQAEEHMQWALQQFPRLSGRIKPVLDSWQREAAREHIPLPVICHMCYAENAPGATYCDQCGVAFGTRSGIEQRIMWQGGPLVVVRGWIVTAATVLFALVVLMLLPTAVSVPIIAASVIVGGVIFIKWAGGTLGTAGD